MWNSNKWLLDVIGWNWMLMIIVYKIISTLLPNNKVIISIGDVFSDLFAVFKKKE